MRQSKRSLKDRFTRTAVAALSTGAVFGLLASPASASTTTQPVAGTTLSDISIAIGTPLSAFTNFNPGGTATASGTLIATDTSASPALTVQDAATGTPGHMLAAGTGCTGSETSLTNALQVTVSSTGWTSATGSPLSISGTAQTIANAAAPQSASTLTTGYTQSIGAGEAMLTGCVYSLTATYTLS